MLQNDGKCEFLRFLLEFGNTGSFCLDFASNSWSQWFFLEFAIFFFYFSYFICIAMSLTPSMGPILQTVMRQNMFLIQVILSITNRRHFTLMFVYVLVSCPENTTDSICVPWNRYASAETQSSINERSENNTCCLLACLWALAVLKICPIGPHDNLMAVCLSGWCGP